MSALLRISDVIAVASRRRLTSNAGPLMGLCRHGARLPLATSAICILLPCANWKEFETSLRLAPVQKHSQGPKQVAGVPPLQAICEEWHSIIAESDLQVVFTGPLGMRPFPAIVFLRAFSENSTAASCVKLLPMAATLAQSAACAVTENAHTVTAATKPSLKICMGPPPV